MELRRLRTRAPYSSSGAISFYFGDFGIFSIFLGRNDDHSEVRSFGDGLERVERFSCLPTWRTFLKTNPRDHVGACRGRPEMQGGCKDVHPGLQVSGPPSIHVRRLRIEHGWSDTKNICLVFSHSRPITIFGFCSR